MSSLPKNIPDCTIFLLAKAYQKGHKLIKQLLKPYGLTNLQHLVLEGLWYQEGVTAAELGKMLTLDKATLSGVLDRMLESDWIHKKRDSNDGRLFRLYTTEKTNRMKTRLIAVRAEANASFLAGLSKEDQVLFKRYLIDLI